MKSKWLIVLAIVLAAFGFGLVGCGGGSSSGGGGDEVFYHNFASEANPLTITLGDNFQYGEGYQGQYKKADLFNGNKVEAGDTYWLKVKFTASRDLEDAMWVGLVDTVTGYWNPLTWDGDDDDDEGALLAPDEEDATYVVSEGEVVDILVKMVALKSSPSKALDENVLNIQTKGDGEQGTSGSGVEGAVDLVFTQFVFAKDVTWDASKVPGAPKAPPPPLEITFGTSATVVTPIGTDVEVTYIEGGYQVEIGGTVGSWDDGGSTYAYFQADLGTKTLADYTELHCTFAGTDGDTNYKSVRVFAYNAAPTGYLSDSAGLTGNDYTSGAQNLELEFGTQTSTLATNSNPYIVIYAHYPRGTTFTVKNVKLIPKAEEE